MAGEITPLKISIYLPGKFDSTERETKYSQAIKNCPACASSLVLLVEKLGETSNGGAEEYRNSSIPELSNDCASGWFCNYCGVHIVPGEESNMSTAMKRILSTMRNNQMEGSNVFPFNDSSKDDKVDSPARKVLDDDYHNWESQLQNEFTDFLGGIRDHISEKEVLLRKYQVDLCQREKQLQNSEENFRERMDKFTTSEHELHDRIERLNEYKKTMLKQVSAQMKTLEFRCRAGNGYRKPGPQMFEAWTQTDVTGIGEDLRLNAERRHDYDDLARPLPIDTDLSPAGAEAPPPYSSTQDLSHRTGATAPVIPPISTESGYASIGSSLSPDSARNIWDRYSQSDNVRPQARAVDVNKRSYSPSRSVAIDEVHIRYGAQSPPERETSTAIPVKSTSSVPSRPSSRRIAKYSPRSGETNFSQPGADTSKPNMAPADYWGGWSKPERSTSPSQHSTQTSRASPVMRQGRSLSPNSQGELGRAGREAPPSHEPYGLTAQTHYAGSEVMLTYNMAEANRSQNSEMSSGVPGRLPRNPLSWSDSRDRDVIQDNTTSGEHESYTTPSNIPRPGNVQVEVEKDEIIPEKPKLHSVRSWDIIANNSEHPAPNNGLDGLDIFSPGPTSGGPVPPSSGNLVPTEARQHEDLSKPIQDPRYFQFAPPHKSSGQPSPASDHSNHSSRRDGNLHRKPFHVGGRSKLRHPEHRGSSASDADSRSSAPNYVYNQVGAEEDRGRQISRMVKSGSNIGSYDAKQYSAHQRSTSAGRVLDEGSKRGPVEEGYYDVRGANSQAYPSNEGVDSGVRTERPSRPGRQLPQMSTTIAPSARGNQRQQQPEGHYVDMNGTSDARTVSEPSKGDQPERTSASKSQNPGRFTNKISMLIKKGDYKASQRVAVDQNSPKTAPNVGKIKLDDKSTWAIKKRREESKKQRDSSENSQDLGVSDEVTSSTPKRTPFRRQPIPFSFGAGRRSLNSGVNARGRSPSPMVADHTIVANTESGEVGVMRQSSGRGSGQRRPAPDVPHKGAVINGDDITVDDNANNLKHTPNGHPGGVIISKTYSNNKRQITPPREYSGIPKQSSPNSGKSKLRNYSEYVNNLHVSPRDNIGKRNHSTYDSEV